MATIIVKSENPNFSYVLGKNPNGSALIKSMRRGVAVGWFKDEKTYCMNFRDSKTEVSFKEYEEQEHEYLTITGYNASMAYYSLIKEYYRLNIIDEKDGDGFETSVTLGFLNIKRFDYAEMFMKYFDGQIQFTSKQITKTNYQVTVSGCKSINYVMSVAYLFLFMNGVKNGENIFMEDGMKGSFIELMKRVRAPYFIRYIFKSNFMVDGNKDWLTELEKDSDVELKLLAGNLGNQRKRYILDCGLFGGRDIVDLGCGEGRLTFPLAERKNKKVDYDVFAIDINTELTSYVQKKAENKKLDNVYVYNSFDEFIESNGQDVDVLCTEVMEHLELKDAKKLIRKILSCGNVKSLLLTTPNRDFNQFYKIEEDDNRHDDHKFELTYTEFRVFIEEVKCGRSVEFEYIGDTVNGIRPTLCAILK